MNAMIATPAELKNSHHVEEHRRGHAVSLLASLYLLLCLGKMRVHRCPVLMRKLGQPVDQILGTGIFRVESKLIADQRILLVPSQILLLHLLNRGGEIVQSACQDTAHPHVNTGLRNRVRCQIHLKYGCDAGGQVF